MNTSPPNGHRCRFLGRGVFVNPGGGPSRDLHDNDGASWVSPFPSIRSRLPRKTQAPRFVARVGPLLRTLVRSCRDPNIHDPIPTGLMVSNVFNTETKTFLTSGKLHQAKTKATMRRPLPAATATGFRFQFPFSLPRTFAQTHRRKRVQHTIASWQPERCLSGKQVHDRKQEVLVC